MLLLKTLLNILYPPRCPFCNRLLMPCSDVESGYSREENAARRKILCRSCAGELPWLENSCSQCARPLRENVNGCLQCRNSNFSFAECCALGCYRGKIRETLHRFKYHDQKWLAKPLGKLLSGKLLTMPWISSVELLVPVPLHSRRLAQRGYNQAFLLATVVGKELHLPVLEMLERVRDTQSQTGLNKSQRRANLRGAFRCRQKPGKGSHILLIDDVLTSGNTANEASLALKKGGAGRVSVAVLAR